MAAALDYSNLTLTFADEFNTLSLSSDPKSDATWYNRTAWNGDFGSATFAGSDRNGTFSIGNGLLDIKAQKNEAGKWTSGLLSSVDPNGQGFSQQYGYFEMRAQLPQGQGVWPAFWLVGMNRLEKGSTFTAEIDIMEHYGAMPGTFSSKVHVWQRDGSGGHDWDYHRTPVDVGALYSGFHTYGVLIREDVMTFYFDGVAQWTMDTPDEHKQPMMILADLGLGGGWPIDKAPNGATMTIDYIRAYKEAGFPPPTVGPDGSTVVSPTPPPAPAPEPELLFRFADLFDAAAREALAAKPPLVVKADGGTLVGTAGNDDIRGSAGADRLQGHKGDDVIRAGAGNDTVIGDQGDDLIFGEAGNDTLHGGAGNDMIFGGAGDDFLNGGGGIDLLCGGAGADRYVVRARDKADPVSHADMGGQAPAQWVEIYGLNFGEGDKLVFEGLVGLDAAIGRDNIVSSAKELDLLARHLQADADARTGASTDPVHGGLVLTLADASGAIHVVGIHEGDFVL